MRHPIGQLRRLVVGLILLIWLPLLTAAPAMATATADKECASLEGCYSYDEMDELIHVAEDLVLDFADQEFSPQLLWVELRYVPEGESGKEACLEQPGVQATYTDNSYEYCPSDNTIYIGQTMLWGFYSEIGDVAPIVGLAHEFGHFLQSLAGVSEPTTPQETVHHENQADCVAGAWFEDADQKGLLELPDDRQDVEEILDRIGSSEDDPNRTHGTIEERKRSFNDGWVGGLAACNSYYPATPLRSKQERDRWRLLFRELRRSADSSDALGSSALVSVGAPGATDGSRLPHTPPAVVDALVLADPRRWTLRSPLARPPAGVGPAASLDKGVLLVFSGPVDSGAGQDQKMTTPGELREHPAQEWISSPRYAARMRSSARSSRPVPDRTSSPVSST